MLSSKLLDFLSNPDITVIISLVSLIGVFLTIISIVFIIINIKAVISQNETNIKVERNQRFKNAIEQIGSDKSATVLGAIYTLHRIAKEDKNYIETIFNILSSYVRDTTSKKNYKILYINKPSEPILAIINLLCINQNEFKIYRRPSENIKIIQNNKTDNFRIKINNKIYNFIVRHIIKPKKKLILDFSGAYLRGINFSRAVFEDDIFDGVDFTKSIFYYCFFYRCELNRSIFIASNLEYTNFLYSNMEYSDFTDCSGFGANFNFNLYLNNSIFIGACLEGAYFDASINNTDFTASYLRRATFNNLAYNMEFMGAFSDQSTFENNSLVTFEDRVMFGVDKQPDLSCARSNNDLSYINDSTVVYNEEYAMEIISNYKKHLGIED